MATATKTRASGRFGLTLRINGRCYRVRPLPADQLPDARMVGPIRDAVELIVESIKGRSMRRDFDEQWDRPHHD